MKSNIKIIARKSYFNSYKNRMLIYGENRNKSGIYRRNNLITGQSYIVSAVNINRRIGNYLSRGFLKKELLNNISRISNSLLKYDYLNFSLEIIEYCDC
jgi:group I intron endonuclease